MTTAAPRFRATRCEHGLIMGLCEATTCPGYGASGSKGTAPRKVSPPRCSVCKASRADAVPRGLFRAAKGMRSGGKEYQNRYCGDCWGTKVARDLGTERKRA